MIRSYRDMHVAYCGEWPVGYVSPTSIVLDAPPQVMLGSTIRTWRRLIEESGVDLSVQYIDQEWVAVYEGTPYHFNTYFYLSLRR